MHSTTVLALAAIMTGPNVDHASTLALTLSVRWGWSSLKDRSGTGEVVFVPPRAGASLPTDAAKIAKLVRATTTRAVLACER